MRCSAAGLGFGAGTAIAGPLVGGPIGAALVTGGGNLAARGAQRLTQRRADMARAIAARGETPTQAGLAELDGGDDAMSVPTDSEEFMAAVSAILRAATMRSTAEDGRLPDQCPGRINRDPRREA